MENWRGHEALTMASVRETQDVLARKSPNLKGMRADQHRVATQADSLDRSSRAAIPMMQAADHWDRNHLATVRRLDIACNWRVAIQRQVRAGVMIILRVVPSKYSSALNSA